jgi:hypothetical protein
VKVDKDLSDFFNHDLKIDYQPDNTCRYNILNFGDNYQVLPGQTPVISLEKVDNIKSMEVFIELPLLALQESFTKQPKTS